MLWKTSAPPTVNHYHQALVHLMRAVTLKSIVPKFGVYSILVSRFLFKGEPLEKPPLAMLSLRSSSLDQSREWLQRPVLSCPALHTQPIDLNRNGAKLNCRFPYKLQLIAGGPRRWTPCDHLNHPKQTTPLIWIETKL